MAILTGTFERSIDEKFRVAIPKRLREATQCHDGGVFYVTPGTDGSIALYTEDAFKRLADRLAGVSPTQRHVRAFSRLFYAQAQRLELDRQGRVRIPLELAQLAGLETNGLGKSAVLLGVQDHMELWSVDGWKKYLTERQSHYDEIAEQAFASE